MSGERKEAHTKAALCTTPRGQMEPTATTAATTTPDVVPSIKPETPELAPEAATIAAVYAAAAAAEDAAATSGPGKRAARREKRRVYFDEKKEKKKQLKKQEKETKQQPPEKELDMSDEAVLRRRERSIAKREAYLMAAEEGIKVVIDCGFEADMDPREKKSLSQQIMCVYSVLELAGRSLYRLV